MAFIKRTWLARLGTGLNKFIIGEKDAQDKQTLTNSPDSITQEGDTISAQNLNDLEDRIEDGFEDVANEFVIVDANIANKVPKTTTVNGKALSDNITLNASDVGAVPTTRTVNGKALSSDITIMASDLGIQLTKVSFSTVNGGALPSMDIGELKFVSFGDNGASMPAGSGSYYVAWSQYGTYNATSSAQNAGARIIAGGYNIPTIDDYGGMALVFRVS